MNELRTNVCNVLVIGAGAAGLRAAIEVDRMGAEVVVVAKRANRDAHTVLAAGGINAVLGTRDPEDSWEQHFADTFREGYFLSDPRVVETVVRDAPAAIEELREWGCPFALLEDGRTDQRFFGAHTYRRTCYAGDYTGRAILHTLAAKADELDLRVADRHYVSSLLVQDGTCFGALAFDQDSGERTAFFADAVILATGGHTRVWRRSSSRRDENNGDGMYLALRAGSRLQDMELVQFHPTGMVGPEYLSGTLVTEAVRGEGGRLFNSEGERFMSRYDSRRMELSTRDRIALANYTEVAEGRGSPNGGVFLDISHRPKSFILDKLPRMYRQFIEHQMLDISKQPMEVAPTAHYSMGGVVVDPETHATGVEGLFAVGEIAAGLHGANRLGGNSLTETVVFGRRVGRAAAELSSGREAQLRSRRSLEDAVADLDSFVHEGEEIVRPAQRALREAMWECCGVVRSDEGLRSGLLRVEEIERMVPMIDVRPTAEGFGDLAHVLDLRASVATAKATLLGALERRESRGSHQRSDYPELEPELQVNLRVGLNSSGDMQVESEPVPALPEHLEAVLKGAPELDASRGLLE
jgi:succinate dehydrogenase / fumarate reductase flavoprotein subunit